MTPAMFVHNGNSCILHDERNGMFVGVAYAFRAKEFPVFATFASRLNPDYSYQAILRAIIESLETGLLEKHREVLGPVPLIHGNCAIITGDGQHYAVGVAAGKLHYACPEEGFVNDDQLETALFDNMRFPDRD